MKRCMEGGMMHHYVLMTPSFQVICVDARGRFCERLPNHVGPDVCIIHAVEREEGWFLYQPGRQDMDKKGRGLWFCPQSGQWQFLFPAQAVRRDVTERGKSGENEMFFLSCPAKNDDVRKYYLAHEGWDGISFCAETSRKEALALRFISEEQFSLFASCVKSRWVCSPNGGPARFDLLGSMGDRLKLGGASIDWNSLMIALEDGYERGELVFNEGWKVWRFMRYNPLIILEAFGVDALEELNIQLVSLHGLGAYHDTVWIVTDQGQDACQKVIEAAWPEEAVPITILNVENKGVLTAFEARARLAAEPPLLAPYAPIMFCGTGVVFDNDVRTLLGKVACLSLISTTGNYYQPSSGTVPPDWPEEVFGRVMILPDRTEKTVRIFEAACLGMARYAARYGEAAMGGEPQLVFNTALMRLDYLSGFVGEKRMQTAGDGILPKAFDRRGLACFPREEGRFKKMAAYYEQTRQIWSGEW